MPLGVPANAAAQEIEDYARWADSLWMGASPTLAERDITVMSLGLGGELGEVMGAIAATSPGPQAAVCKELGDVVYYWAMLAVAFRLSPHRLATTLTAGAPAIEGLDSSASLDALAQESSSPSVPPAALALGARCGGVLEQLKKRVRDGVFDSAAFEQEMAACLGAWLALVSTLGLRPSQVLEANRQKVEDRHARGVMRGSGDDR